MFGALEAQPVYRGTRIAGFFKSKLAVLVLMNALLWAALIGAAIALAR